VYFAVIPTLFVVLETEFTSKNLKDLCPVPVNNSHAIFVKTLAVNEMNVSLAESDECFQNLFSSLFDEVPQAICRQGVPASPQRANSKLARYEF